MRASLVLSALLAALAGSPAPAAAQQAADPVADSIVRNLTRGLRIPNQGDAVTAPVTPLDPRAPVQAGTTAPPGLPSVSLMITFATGSADLTPEAQVLVASLARALSSAELAQARIRIEGHTDSVGDAAMNQTLSERRAAAVRDLLVARYGIAAGRLEAMGFGEAAPLVPTADGQPEPRNRRVQIINLGG